MSAITFDTLKFANRLKSAGVPAAQAEAEAEALADVMEIAGRDLVTKEYLDTRLIQLEQRMIIKLGGLMVVAVGIVATLVKIL